MKRCGFFYADRTVPFLPKQQLLPITFDFRYLLLTGDRVFNPSSNKVRWGGGGETVSNSTKTQKIFVHCLWQHSFKDLSVVA